MNKITKLIIAKKCLDMTKAQADIRGKEFTKVYLAFVSLFVWLFQEQSKFFIAYAENNPQMFTGDGGLIIEKYDEFGDMTPSEEFMNTLGSFLIKAHMVWQDATNKEVQSQVNVLMELKNSYAEAYSANRAGELMRAVNDTTKAEVRSLFNKGFKENWSLSEISAAIDEQFTQFGKYRANLIATMEVANAYEVGKKDQFSSYQSYFRVTWYKRSQTQQDSAVRTSHNRNEIDGWIPENTPFSGTGTDHAPHEFNCRCVTLRRMTAPETSDIIAVQFEDDRTAYLNEKQKLEVTNMVQSFRQKAPIIPKLKALTDFGDAGNGQIAAYVPWKDIMTINSITWDDINISEWWAIAGDFTGLQRKEAIIAHEMWHFMDDFIGKMSLTDESYRGIKWSSIYDQMVNAKIGLLSKWQTWDIKGTQYPLDALASKWYDIGLAELFAESVSSYTMWKTAILDEDMRKFLDFIYWK